MMLGTLGTKRTATVI